MVIGQEEKLVPAALKQEQSSGVSKGEVEEAEGACRSSSVTAMHCTDMDSTAPTTSRAVRWMSDPVHNFSSRIRSTVKMMSTVEQPRLEGGQQASQ